MSVSKAMLIKKKICNGIVGKKTDILTELVEDDLLNEEETAACIACDELWLETVDDILDRAMARQE